jgi:hypothetical protein
MLCIRSNFRRGLALNPEVRCSATSSFTQPNFLSFHTPTPMPPRPFVNDALWRCLCPGFPANASAPVIARMTPARALRNRPREAHPPRQRRAYSQSIATSHMATTSSPRQTRLPSVLEVRCSPALRSPATSHHSPNSPRTYFTNTCAMKVQKATSTRFSTSAEFW